MTPQERADSYAEKMNKRFWSNVSLLAGLAMLAAPLLWVLYLAADQVFNGTPWLLWTLGSIVYGALTLFLLIRGNKYE